VNDLDLAESLRQAKNGDERGFAVLWRALQPAVLRYLRVVVADAAEDVAAETWLQVARDFPVFRGGLDRFRTWLFAIARNRALDELRRSGRRRENATAPGELPVTLAGPDASEEALSWLATESALALIATLPPDQAEAVALRIVAGLNPRQAAAVLGKRPGAVRTAALRGLRGLAQRLREAAQSGTSSDQLPPDIAWPGVRGMPVQRTRPRRPATEPPAGGVTR
jgi:RNA polymerase sigma-70 factor (ECF subfamily)